MNALKIWECLASDVLLFRVPPTFYLLKKWLNKILNLQKKIVLLNNFRATNDNKGLLWYRKKPLDWSLKKIAIL